MSERAIFIYLFVFYLILTGVLRGGLACPAAAAMHFFGDFYVAK